MSARPAFSALVRSARHARPAGRPATAEAPVAIPSGALVVGTIAPLRKDAGFDVWVDVAHAVCDAYPTVHFVAVGDGPLAGEIRTRIRATGHHHRIHLVPGRHRPPSDVRDFEALRIGRGTRPIRRADPAAAQPSARATFGYPLNRLDLYLNVSTGASVAPLIDALSAGVPVISAASEAARRLVRHNGEGMLVAPGDRAAFVSVIELLLDDPQRRARLGATARDRATNAAQAAAG